MQTVQMVYPRQRHLGVVLTVLLTCMIVSKAAIVHKLDQSDVQGLESHQLAYRHQAIPSKIETSQFITLESAHSDFENSLDKRQRLTFDQLWSRLRIGTLWIIWSGTRLNALLNPDPSPPGKFIQSLKDMYSQIRMAVINEWAKLPPQSYVRIICGRLILTILPPADRTVPWSEVEELAYGLTLMVSAGLGGLVSGTYLPVATSVVYYYYLQVIQPASSGQTAVGASGGSTNLIAAPPPP